MMYLQKSLHVLVVFVSLLMAKIALMQDDVKLLFFYPLPPSHAVVLKDNNNLRSM